MSGPQILPFIRFAGKVTALRNTGTVCAYDCRLLYCLRGKGSLTLDDGVRELLPGTLCLYPSGTRYLITGDRSDPLELIVLNFDYYSDRSDQETSLPPVPVGEFDPEKVIASWKNTCETCFMTPQILPGMQLLEGDLMELIREWQVAKIHYREVVSSLLSALLYRVLQQTSISPESGERADELLAYIHGHFAERLDYEELAALFHYHPYYLNTLIRSRTGQSLHKYIMGCRIREACRMLTSTEEPIGSVARAVGFENKDHFSACFKKMVGISPLQYRKGHHL